MSFTVIRVFAARVIAVDAAVAVIVAAVAAGHLACLRLAAAGLGGGAGAAVVVVAVSAWPRGARVKTSRPHHRQ